MLTNNMKNLTTTTKTILFASLIAAMILPFSTMDFAEAEKREKQDKIDAKKHRDFIDAKIKDLKEKTTPSDKTNKEIKRYGLMKQLVNIQEQIDNSTDETEIEKFNAKGLKIIQKIQNSYDSEDREIAQVKKIDSVLKVGLFGNDIDFNAQQHRQPDCYNPNHDYANIEGDGTADSSGIEMEIRMLSYPNKVGTGEIGNCNHKSIDIGTTHINGPQGWCYVVINPSPGVYDMECDKIKENQIAIVTTNAVYGWFTENYASDGWAIMSTF